MTFQFFLSPKGTLKNIHLYIDIPTCKEKFSFRTALRIAANQWDMEKQRPINIYIKKYKKLNSILDAIKINITEYLNKRRKENKTITQKGISKEVHKICSEKLSSIPAQGSLLFYMQSYIDSKKDFIRHSTYKRYNVFYRLIQRFEGHLMDKLYIKDININFIKKFMTFGQAEEYSENTLYRSLHFVKTILHFLEKKGIKTQVRELDIRKEKQQKTVIILSEKEINKVQNTPIPQELQCAKDWLIISCYTGQRFSDFIQFRNTQLITINEKICISFTQQKTGKDIILPLHPKVINIIQQNHNNFPLPLDNSLYNKQIKKIAQLAGINETIKSRKRIGFRSKEMKIEKWKNISSHIGRRSFASNFYGKIPTPLLMQATGHSTEKMFLNYINSLNHERIITLGNYFEKIEATRN